jgi:hypothetical protein
MRILPVTALLCRPRRRPRDQLSRGAPRQRLMGPESLSVVGYAGVIVEEKEKR